MCSSPVAAQEAGNPVTRFFKGLFGSESASPAAATPEPVGSAPQAKGVSDNPIKTSPEQAKSKTPRAKSSETARGDPGAAKPPGAEPPRTATKPVQVPRKTASGTPAADESRGTGTSAPAGSSRPAAKPLDAAKTVGPAPAPAARPAGKPVVAPAPVEAQARLTPVPQPASATPPAIPTSPAAAVARVNGYFNTIDQLTASFVQTSAGGQSLQGTLTLKRPGQLRFAYAPPSTLEVVSDGRSVAVRDQKLGTNDVYPVGQTPLKFLLKDDFDLSRDTQVRDVQTSADGLVTVKFEDSATFGGTSKISLRFDARAGRLRGWTVLDPQGFETTVTLSDVNVVQRSQTRASN